MKLIDFVRAATFREFQKYRLTAKLIVTRQISYFLDIIRYHINCD